MQYLGKVSNGEDELEVWINGPRLYLRVGEKGWTRLKPVETSAGPSLDQQREQYINQEASHG